MTDHPDPCSFAGVALAAAASETPETSAITRHDGWTPTRQAAFLRALSATHNVTAAARAVGMGRQSAYRLRARLQGQPFDKAWQAAFLNRFDVLAEAALDRALNGVEVPHYYNGELIGTSRKYDERLTLALLASRRSFEPAKPFRREPAAAFKAHELEALIERVAAGPQDWLDEPDDERDARLDREAAPAAPGAEGAGPPPDLPAPDCDQ